MAIAFLSGGLVGLRGRIGNLMYKMVGGKCIVSVVPPVVENPKSEDQVIARNRFIAATSFWKTLNDVEQALWTDAVGLLPNRPDTGTSDRWFPSYYNDMSGFNYFVGINCQLLACGAAMTTIAPSPTPLSAPDTPLTMAYDPADEIILAGTYDADTLDAGNYYLQIRGRARHAKSLKFDAIIDAVVIVGATPFDISTLDPIDEWKIGHGKDITTVPFADLPEDAYELRWVLVGEDGRMSQESTSYFITGGGVVALSIVSIFPVSGPLAGGTPVQIIGTGFGAGTTAWIVDSALADCPLASLVVVSSTEILAVTTAGAVGADCDVKVKRGATTETLDDAWEYTA